MIILMCDGSSKGNPGPMTIGFVIWDRSKDAREMRPAYRHSEPKGHGTNNEAEWMAVIGGLEKIKAKGIKNEEVYVYSDSQLVIKQINNDYQVKHPNIIPLDRKFRALWIELDKRGVKIWFYWIPRQLTHLADVEANRTHQTIQREITAVVPAGQPIDASDGG